MRKDKSAQKRKKKSIKTTTKNYRLSKVNPSTRREKKKKLQSSHPPTIAEKNVTTTIEGTALRVISAPTAMISCQTQPRYKLS